MLDAIQAQNVCQAQSAQMIKQHAVSNDGYCSMSDFGDQVSLGKGINDFWAAQTDDIARMLSSNRTSMDNLLSSSVSWNLTGWRSGSNFIDGTHIIPDSTEVTRTEMNNISLKNGLNVDVSTVRGEKDAIMMSTLTISKPDGSVFNIDTNEDIRFQIDEDGSLLVHHMNTDNFYRYQNDNSVTQIDVSHFNENAGSVYIKQSDNIDITAGSGNDCILVLTGGGNVNAGDGDDIIKISEFVRGVTNIDAGSGNDVCSAESIQDGVLISMGSGDDIVQTNNNSGTVDLGVGNNQYFENDIYRSASNTGSVTAGDGNNKIMSRMAGNINLGAGNNTIVAQFLRNATMGDGNNIIYAELIENTNIGDGNNIIESATMRDVSIGDGDNRITTDKLNNNLSVGDGNNEIDINEAYRSSLNFGSGNNSINIFDTHSFGMSGGNGNNDIAIGSLRHNSSLSVGDGDSTVSIKKTSYDADINIGNGNNTLGIGEIYGHETYINIGNGNNNIALMWHSLNKPGDSKAPTVTLGNGNNNISLEQNFKINMGTGTNNIFEYALHSAQFNTIQDWIDGRG